MQTKKSVVIGLTGRLDSAVAAYLLKKQGFHVIGVSVFFCDPKLPEAKLGGSFIIDSLEANKALADSMDISFYAVNAEAEYRGLIVDPFVESRLFGQQFSIETTLNKLLFEILAEKAQKLGANEFATGHYAKVGRSQKGGEVGLIVANDLESDQSFHLSKTPRALLSKVIFPLSDLRKSEVKKVGKLIAGKPAPSRPLESELLFCHSDLVEVVTKYSAAKLYREGLVIKYTEDSGLGDYNGVHQYYTSQRKLINQSSGTSLDRDLMVVGIEAARGIVYVDFPRNIAQTHLIVHQLDFENGFDQTRAREVWLQVAPYSRRVKGKLHFLNNQFGLIELAEELYAEAFPGQVISMATKAAAGAKVLGSARVLKSGELKEREFFELPERAREDEEEDTEKKWEFIF